MDLCFHSNVWIHCINRPLWLFATAPSVVVIDCLFTKEQIHFGNPRVQLEPTADWMEWFFTEKTYTNSYQRLTCLHGAKWACCVVHLLTYYWVSHTFFTHQFEGTATTNFLTLRKISCSQLLSSSNVRNPITNYISSTSSAKEILTVQFLLL